MNRFRHPVVQVTPTDRVIVAEHTLLVDALNDAARRDADAQPGVWHLVDEPATDRQHARTH